MALNDDISFGDEELAEKIERDRERFEYNINGIDTPMNYTPLNLPEHRKERMRKSYDLVCVQDFDNDDYHLTDEERAAKSEYFAHFNRMMKCKSKYRKLDEYIKAWRVTMECIRAVASTNNVYDPEDFVVKVLKGKLCIYGVKMPKYIGKDKKELNWRVIGEYVTNPELDINDLLKKQEVSAYDVIDPNEIGELQNILFGYDVGDELLKIEEEISDPSLRLLEPEDIAEGKMDSRIAVPLTKTEFKSLVKNTNFISGAKLYKRQNDVTGEASMRQFAFELSEDDFKHIESMDSERGYTSKGDVPEFHGNPMKDSDVEAYMAELAEWEENNVKTEYCGRVRTISEIQEIEIKQMLEDNGYDLHKFYSYEDDAKKLMRIQKKNKKKEKRLRKSLIKLKERSEDRDNSINTKKKKHKKKDKTGYKNKVKHAAESLLTSGTDFSNFDDYTKAMEGWDE